MPRELAVRAPDSSVQPASDSESASFKRWLDRFLAEARTLARFQHPNIVRVLTSFEANGTGYMIRDYEHGDSLEDILDRRQTLEEEELLAIVLPVLGGLEKVHERGFIHRDIKPANIMIRKDDSPVLIDCGSARQALGAETGALTIMVTSGYAPYEQYSTEGKQQGGVDSHLWPRCHPLSGGTRARANGRSRSHPRPGAPDPLIDVRKIGKDRYSGGFLEAVAHALRFRHQDRPRSVDEWRREFGARPDETPNPKPQDNASDGCGAWR
ncbi:MAG: serine/threonine-protein kinase [Gammaproteobacteria bacterium]